MKEGGNVGSSNISPVRRVQVLNDLESTVQQPSRTYGMKEMEGKETSATSNGTGGIFVGEPVELANGQDGQTSST